MVSLKCSVGLFLSTMQVSFGIPEPSEGVGERLEARARTVVRRAIELTRYVGRSVFSVVRRLVMTSVSSSSSPLTPPHQP